MYFRFWCLRRVDTKDGELVYRLEPHMDLFPEMTVLYE